MTYGMKLVARTIYDKSNGQVNTTHLFSFGGHPKEKAPFVWTFSLFHK